MDQTMYYAAIIKFGKQICNFDISKHLIVCGIAVWMSLTLEEYKLNKSN